MFRSRGETTRLSLYDDDDADHDRRVKENNYNDDDDGDDNDHAQTNSTHLRTLYSWTLTSDLICTDERGGMKRKGYEWLMGH